MGTTLQPASGELHLLSATTAFRPHSVGCRTHRPPRRNSASWVERRRANRSVSTVARPFGRTIHGKHYGVGSDRVSTASKPPDVTADGAPDPASGDRPQGVFGDRFEGVRQGWLPTGLGRERAYPLGPRFADPRQELARGGSAPLRSPEAGAPAGVRGRGVCPPFRLTARPCRIVAPLPAPPAYRWPSSPTGGPRRWPLASRRIENLEGAATERHPAHAFLDKVVHRGQGISPRWQATSTRCTAARRMSHFGWGLETWRTQGVEFGSGWESGHATAFFIALWPSVRSPCSWRAHTGMIDSPYTWAYG